MNPPAASHASGGVPPETEVFARILDALPYPIFWKGRDLRYLGCNAAFARHAGRRHPGEVVGLNDYDMPWRPEQTEFFRASDRQVLETGQPFPTFEALVRKGNGQQGWMQAIKVPLLNARGEVFAVLGISVEVTERHEAQKQLQVALAAREAANAMLKAQVAEREAAERALAASELRLQTVVRGAQAIIWALDRQGICTFMDGGGLAELGLTPEQVVGRSAFELLSTRSDLQALLRRALAGEAFTTSVTLGKFCYEVRCKPVLDESGALTSVIGTVVDVTERVRYREMLEAELERARSQLLQVERLATLGTLAAGVGHELRNIATVLTSLRSSFAERASQAIPPTAEEVEELRRACEHVATHGKHLMDLGRPGRMMVERLDLRELVAGSLAMLRTAGRTKHVQVSHVVPDSPLWVQVSRTRVEQIVLNLVGNAADAVEGIRGRPPEVRVRLFEDRSEGFACCSVEDNGVGIPEDKLSAIFEPWFTTKAPGRGSGLGLPVVRNILQECGGDLRVDSRINEGSAFTFRLPLAPPA